MPDRPMSDEEAVLAANEEFYSAFSTRDLAAMDALWAEETPVACIHPGWDVLLGRDLVMESWAAILGGPGAPQISCEAPRAFVHGASAFVICHEVLAQQGRLIATNVFVREGGLAHGPPPGRPRRPAHAHPRPQRTPARDAALIHFHARIACCSSRTAATTRGLGRL